MSDTRALRQAVAKNNATKVRSLLSQGGATVDAEVLLLAASRGHAAVLQMLLEAGAALSASEAPGLLIAAVQSPDGTATLSHLLQAIPADGLNGTVREWTPLGHIVSATGSLFDIHTPRNIRNAVRRQIPPSCGDGRD